MREQFDILYITRIFTWTLMQMLQSDWLSHCTLSAISVQWLGEVDQISFLQSLERIFKTKRIIEFLIMRRLEEGHSGFPEYKKNTRSFWKKLISARKQLTHFSKCGTFSQVRHIFPSVTQFFKLWLIFPSVTQFSNCDPFFRSAAHFSKWNTFFQVWCDPIF